MLAPWVWRSKNWIARCPACGRQYTYGDVVCDNDGHNLIAVILPNRDKESEFTNPQILLLKSERYNGPTYETFLCENGDCMTFVKGSNIRVKYPLGLRIVSFVAFLCHMLFLLAWHLFAALLVAIVFYGIYPSAVLQIGLLIYGLYHFIPRYVKCYQRHRPFRRWVSFRRANEGAMVSQTTGRYS